MQDVVIVEACRTAVGSFGGSLKPLDADDLAVSVIKGALQRTGLDPLQVDEVILGHCRQSSDMSNTARYAALRAGIPEEVPANTVMCACASGMLAVNNAVNAIRTGQAEVVLAGGTESMSNAIFYLSNARWGVGTGTTQLKDSLTEAQFCSQPQDIYGRFNMGITAENVAAKMGITRDEQDQFALASQQKAAAAIASGRFRDEIIPLTVPQGRKKEPIVFDVDEFPRETSLEKLAKLRDRNILNEEEYVSLKQAIISRHVDYKGGAKSGVAYVVLGWLLGLFGVHNYYAGYTRKATIQLLITLFSGFLCFIPLVFVQVWAIAEICLINKDAADVPFRGDVSLVKILRIAAVAFYIVLYFLSFLGMYGNPEPQPSNPPAAFTQLPPQGRPAFMLVP